MHLVFLNQYYPPDAAPTGVMLEDLVRQLVRQGHEVTVLCAAGGYAGGRGGFTQATDDMKGRDAFTHASEGAASSGPDALDDTGRTPESKPAIVRIGATSFGRGSFVGKLLDYASYYFGVSWRLMTLRPRPDRIVALTTPPYLSVLARATSRFRGADHAHWVMDLYPDVMVAHGMVAERSMANRILAGLTRWGLGGKRCAAVVTLGPDMAERVGRYVDESGELAVGGGEEKVELSVVRGRKVEGDVSEGEFIIQHSKFKIVSWVPLWGTNGRDASNGINGSFTQPSDDTQPVASAAAAALRRERGWGVTDLVVMYSGNMGLGHRFGEILTAARELSDCSEGDQDGRPRMAADGILKSTAGERVRFVFFGAGKRRDEVLKFMAGNPDCNMEMHDYAPADLLTAHLQSADVHLASLDAEWTGTMVPSKLQGIFAAARPVIFIGSEASSIGQWVGESGGGWVVKPGDVAGLLAALDEARNPSVRLARGRAARDFAAIHFTKDLNVAKVAAFFEGGGK